MGNEHFLDLALPRPRGHKKRLSKLAIPNRLVHAPNRPPEEAGRTWRGRYERTGISRDARRGRDSDRKELTTMGRFVAFGEILLRMSPPGRELLLQTPRLDVWIGGAEANVATALARLGHDTAIVSAVPD